MKKSSIIAVVAMLSLSVAALTYFLPKTNSAQSNVEEATAQSVENPTIALPNNALAFERPLSKMAQNGSKKHFFETKKAENEENEGEEEDEMNPAQNFQEALELERIRTLDPALGYVPKERKQAAMEKTIQMQQQMTSGLNTRGSLQKARWNSRGPGNVGGRTRAMLVDAGDPTRQTMFAGGVSGGLFKTTNVGEGTTRWVQVNDWLDNLSLNCLAQDPRNAKIMYAGTGDCDGNDVNGLGIFKSINGGTTWNRVPSTTNDQFGNVTAIVVTPDSGHIFAATFSGLYKSKDDGANWDKVLGAGLRFGSADNIFYRLERTSSGRLYACGSSRVYKSNGFGELGSWESLAKNSTTYPTGWARTEMAVSPSNQDIIYIVGNVGGKGTAVYSTTDGGATWRAGTKPFWSDGGRAASDADFTRGQAWYDLNLAVAPDDPNFIILGGVDQFRSFDGGRSWSQMTSWAAPVGAANYAHADHHGALFDPQNPSVFYLGTDGGVFRFDNPRTTFKISEKTSNYVTTQFYACAIHPDSGVNHFMAGAQDNGTLIVRSPGIGNVNGRSIGGDGFVCFIDQNDPKYQIGSIYYGDWKLSTDGGNSFSGGQLSNGGFFNPADYDDNEKILYAQTKDGDLWRWKIKTNEVAILDVAGVSFGDVSSVYTDLNKKNRVYVGNANGGSSNLYVMDDASEGKTINNVRLVGRFTGRMSSIDVEKGDTNHIIVAMSNYGVQSIQETKDGGATWVSQEGNLPDMPVRWAIFNPNDKRSAIIATDAGVWSTDFLAGAATVWMPPYPGRGTPLVRTDMLQIRQSDKMVLAATYGRGMWTTTSFAAPKANINAYPVGYIGGSVAMKGENSNAADSFNWDFGDGGKDTLENTAHTYNAIGTYKLSLFINGDNELKTARNLKILPQLSAPYKNGVAGYDGSFEGDDTHFGVYTEGGSTFERGKSNVPGKSGTHTGNNAYVLGIKESAYQKNTTSYLYLPMYDLSEKGIYQFSFWSAYDLQKGYAGLQVQYSLDKGASWQILGTDADPSWYDYRNNSVAGGAFPNGEPSFSNVLDDWARFKLNVSFLSGNKNVAFRFVFKSGTVGSGAGIAIDDVEVSKYTGELKTLVTNKTAIYDKGNGIDVTFQTQPEFKAKSFELEISENGTKFTKIATFNAQGISSEELQTYSFKYLGSKFDFYYFKVKAINQDTTVNFYSPIFIAKRNKDAAAAILKTFPSPFTNSITLLFNDLIQSNVSYVLYDVAGRIILQNTVEMNGVSYEIKTKGLVSGVYLLQFQIGTAKPETIKVYGGDL